MASVPSTRVESVMVGLLVPAALAPRRCLVSRGTTLYQAGCAGEATGRSLPPSARTARDWPTALTRLACTRPSTADRHGSLEPRDAERDPRPGPAHHHHRLLPAAGLVHRGAARARASRTRSATALPRAVPRRGGAASSREQELRRARHRHRRRLALRPHGGRQVVVLLRRSSGSRGITGHVDRSAGGGWTAPARPHPLRGHGGLPARRRGRAGSRPARSSTRRSSRRPSGSPTGR